jgi:hypothetical protein
VSGVAACAVGERGGMAALCSDVRRDFWWFLQRVNVPVELSHCVDDVFNVFGGESVPQLTIYEEFLVCDGQRRVHFDQKIPLWRGVASGWVGGS